MPNSVSLANGTCVFLSFFSISDHPLHLTWRSGANYNLARMEPRVLACGGWALGILECTTVSRHGVMRSYHPLHQPWTTAGRLTQGIPTDSVSFYINRYRELIVDIKVYFWTIRHTQLAWVERQGWAGGVNGGKTGTYVILSTRF